jgi:hypothetical protein
MTCIVSGDSDLYGLGVRIGLYLTGTACILAKIFAPSRAGGLISGLHVLIFAITLTLIKNVIQGRPAMLELYIVLTTTQILNLMLQISGAAFSGIASALSTALVTVAQFAVTLWICWGRRPSGLEKYDEGCARSVRFFGVVDVVGSFGTFLAVLPIVVIGITLSILVGITWSMLVGEASIFHSIDAARKKMGLRARLMRSDSMAGWFSQISTLLAAEDGDTRGYTPIPRVHVSWIGTDIRELIGLLGALAMSIWFTEDTLRLSMVQVDDNLLSTGQLLPLVVGFVSIMSVFAGWLNDRMLNVVAEQMYANKRATPQGDVEL